MKFEELPAPTHVIRIRYEVPGRPHKNVLDLTYSIDPITGSGIARFTLEAMQDIVALGRANGIDIEDAAIADLSNRI